MATIRNEVAPAGNGRDPKATIGPKPTTAQRRALVRLCAELLPLPSRSFAFPEVVGGSVYR